MKRKPNILFLMTDHTNAQAFAPGSPCLTPHVDALASDGIQFDDDGVEPDIASRSSLDRLMKQPGSRLPNFDHGRRIGVGGQSGSRLPHHDAGAVEPWQRHGWRREQDQPGDPEPRQVGKPGGCDLGIGREAGYQCDGLG